MRIIPVALVFVALAFAQQVQGQLLWKQEDSLFGQLPPHFHVYHHSGKINNQLVNAWYVRVRLDDPAVQFNTVTVTRTPANHSANNPSAYLLVNGGLFDTTNFRLLSVVISNTILRSYNITSLLSNQSGLYYYPTRSAFGISKSRQADIAWLFTDTLRRWPYAFQAGPVLARGKQASPILADLNTLDEWKEWKMRTAIGGGPVLVHDSKVRITNQEEQLYPTGIDDADARTVIGYTNDQELIILAVEGKTRESAGISLRGAAEIMHSLGCVEAMNLNTGNSAFLLVNGRETISRTVKDTFIPVIFLVEPMKRERKKARLKL